MEMDFKKVTQKFSIFQKKEKIKVSMDAHRDWRNSFIFFSVLALGLTLGSIFLFIQIDQDRLFIAEEGNGVKIKKYNTTRLVETIKRFEQKELELEELRSKRPGLIDPSQ